MATNPYTAPSISGYNSSPPPDAGETTAANTVEWAKHKDKLGDPIKTLSETDITNTTTAFGKVINTDADENNSMAGSLAFAESILTISSGSVTARRSAHAMAAETGTTDDLANITTGSISDFAILIITPDTGDTITVKDAATGAGEIHLDNSRDFVMSLNDSLLLQRRGADWYEIGRSTPNVLIQMLNTQTGAVATGTTVMVNDDTIPQNDEGDEFMTRAITPNATANELVIEVVALVSNSVAGANQIIMGLYQDSTVNALAAIMATNQAATHFSILVLTHKMAAGTTSSTTFKVRIGGASAGTITFNGTGSARKLGGVMASSITIRETTV